MKSLGANLKTTFKSLSRQSSFQNETAEEEEEIDEGNRSIFMDIINQLRSGTDFHKITLPTFILEPRSMCERLSDFFCYQEYLFRLLVITDPAERALQLIRWIMSGHHTRPKGVKKPFNPILGEFFRCEFKESDKSSSFYICEQVSHHPPKSAFFYANATHKIWVAGELRPHPRFFGNSAGTIMGGGATLYLGQDMDEYNMTNPNVYARSLLLGKMFMELGDTCEIHSKNNDISCLLEFKQRVCFIILILKGFFGGSDKDAVTGKVFSPSTQDIVFEISGKWSGTTISRDASGVERIVFDKHPPESPTAKVVVPEDQQEEFESRRLWKHVAAAVIAADHKAATLEKTKIEDNQRLLVKQRAESGVKWEARFFTCNEKDEWIPIILETIKKDVNSIDDQVIRDFIYSKPVNDIHKSFWVPAPAPADDGTEEST